MNERDSETSKENEMQPDALLPIRGNPYIERLALALAELREGDPDFAEASVLYEEDMGEWQGAVYLLSGCGPVWDRMRSAVLAERTIAPVIDELDDPGWGWSVSETEVMKWAAHFWDQGRNPACFPYVFDAARFRRWIVACQLRKGVVARVDPVHLREGRPR